MARPRPDALALAERYALSMRLPPTRGASGTHAGQGTGASTEFRDHRLYQPGDDVRHLDWRAYARTDQLLLKRYREEVRPTLDLLVDASASMATDPEKEQRAIDLAALFAHAAAADGFYVRVTLLGDRAERPGTDQLFGDGAELVGVRPLVEALAGVRTTSGGLLILISDFLSPHAAPSLVRGLRAGRVALVQVLSAWDAEPEVGGSVRLVDAETQDEVELVLDRTTVDRYLERLGRLNAGLAEEARRRGGLFASLRADDDLETSCGVLLDRGILGPAS
ncbi:MAG: DUF58 domain-containing protein [Proteobacteria bacterium]|nr:DUF58 domain-containing protein [Pseudomonadota bacterium]MCP4920468.1 DUF58 domain-containing protein [Pseudomonadota bacterium]